MFDIACVGDIAVDYISTIADFPQKNSNADVIEFSRSFGGSAANTAIMCARLGSKTTMQACIGADFPDEYMERLKKLNLHNDLYRSEHNTTSAFLFSNGEEQLTFFYRGAAEDVKIIEPNERILESKIIHISRDFTDIAKKIIQKSNAKISFNPGYGLDEIEESELGHILEYTDILFINQHEEKYLTELFGTVDICELGPDIVVSTLGSQGCKVISNSEVITVGVVPADLVDPTGAGDSFAAGFLTGFVKNYPIEKCAQIGSAVASVTIRSRSTHPGISFDDVMNTVKEHYKNVN